MRFDDAAINVRPSLGEPRRFPGAAAAISVVFKNKINRGKVTNAGGRRFVLLSVCLKFVPSADNKSLAAKVFTAVFRRPDKRAENRFRPC